jgi:16S rRNA processing protein RimM
VAVEVLTDFPDRFDTLKTVYLGDPQEAESWRVESTRWHRDRILLTIQGCSDRTTADGLRGLLVQIPVEEAMPLPEDEYYPHELIGLDVTTVEGEELGKVSDILLTNANDVYVVVGARGQILLPAIADVIERVDLEMGEIVITPMQGLI